MKSPCGAVASDDREEAIPVAASMHTNPSETMDIPNFDSNLHALAEDYFNFPVIDYHNEKQSQIEVFGGMTGYFLRKKAVVEKICQPMEPMKTVYESRLQEFIIEGIEDEIDVDDILDDIQPENESTVNVGPYDSDDHFTVNTETLFSPLPQLALDLNVLIQEQTVDGSNDAAIIPVLAKQIGNHFPCLNYIGHSLMKNFS